MPAARVIQEQANITKTNLEAYWTVMRKQRQKGTKANEGEARWMRRRARAWRSGKQSASQATYTIVRTCPATGQSGRIITRGRGRGARKKGSADRHYDRKAGIG